MDIEERQTSKGILHGTGHSPDDGPGHRPGCGGEAALENIRVTIGAVTGALSQMRNETRVVELCEQLEHLYAAQHLLAGTGLSPDDDENPYRSDPDLIARPGG